MSSDLVHKDNVDSIDSPCAAAQSESAEEPLGGENFLSADSVFGRDHLSSLKALQHQMLLDGRHVVDLSMVNPDLQPPRVVLDRLLEFVTKSQNHRYSVSRGVRRLREAFASKYASRFDVTLDPDAEVCVCLGSKDATYHALKSLLSPGDRVVIGSPSYPAHVSSVTLAGGRAVPWRHQFDGAEAAHDLDALLSSSRAKVVLLNFPSNPAGMVVSESWWRSVGEVCKKRNVTVINDFVYGEMCFSGKAAVSALSMRSLGVRCVEVYSLSKAYNVPGWRVGALVGDAAVVQRVARWKSHSDYGLFLPLQYAAAVALTSSQDLVRSTVMAYERRLRVLASGLRTLGWEVVEPNAGACLWVRYSANKKGDGARSEKNPSVAFARRLLSDTGVLATPGVVFGDEWEDYVRFSAVVSEERMREVVAVLATAAAI